MSTLQRYEELKEEIEDLKRKKAEATGILSELKKQLQRDFKCSTLKEAQTLLKKTKAQAEKTEQQFEIAMDHFENEWAEVLDA